MKSRSAVFLGYDTKIHLGDSQFRHEDKVHIDASGAVATGLAGVFLGDDHTRRQAEIPEAVEKSTDPSGRCNLRKAIDSVIFEMRVKTDQEYDGYSRGYPAQQKLLVGYFEASPRAWTGTEWKPS